MLEYELPARMAGVNEENTPLSQSPWDEQTAGVYSSSSDRKTLIVLALHAVSYEA